MLAQSIFSSFPDLTTIILSFAVVILWWYNVKTKKYPPGPWGIPLFGCIPFKLRGSSPLDLARLARQYGKVSSIKMGSKCLIILNDYDTIKEAFIKSKAFVRRPVELMRAAGLHNTLLDAQGKDIILLRRLFLRVTKPRLEDNLLEEINYILEAFKSLGEREFDPSQLISMFASNVVSDISFGQRFDYEDEEYQKTVSSMEQIVLQTVIDINGFFFSWISRVPFLQRLLQNDHVKQLKERMGKIVDQNVKQARTNHVHGSIEHFVDVFLTERQNQVDKTGNEGLYTDDCMSKHVLSSFNIGSETSSSGISWLIYIIGKYSSVYDKIREEIQTVIGTDRNPTLMDQSRMPYINAVITEIYRYSSASPFSFFYTNDFETELSGYLISKNSIVSANLWAVHHDPQIWKDPEEFRPERFLDDKGKLQKTDYVIPFGIGKRRCLAEPVVNSLYFLFLTSLCQRFRIEIKEDLNSSAMPKLSMANKTNPFNIRVISV